MNAAPGEVLSTLNRDGSRHWIQPKLADGRFLRRRRVVGYALVVLFVLLPRIRIGGRPAFLIDLVDRQLDLFGAVFRPSDGFMLALAGIIVAFAVFLVTALWGRVWCGWGCPQTIYLELVFRPIERWLEGHRGQRTSPARKLVKWVLFAALSFALANIFLAYFVGTDRLETWVFRSPLEHPVGFWIVAGVSGLILFDFGWFREQMCIVACPYGRLQSVLLDDQSLVVGYDTDRGEPRGKRKKKLPVIKTTGDCVDCGACVSVCPTGIDIRDGLQMECVGCAQCIDACDDVMDKLRRKRGLIRYTSGDELAGKPRHMLRARTIIYPAVLAVAAALLAFKVARTAGTEVWIERVNGPSFVTLPDGTISAQARIKLENGTDTPTTYFFTLPDAPDASLRAQSSYVIGPHHSLEIVLFVDVAPSSFVGGTRRLYVKIHDTQGFTRVVRVTLLGPEGKAP